MGAVGSREGQRVAGREADVTDHGEAVAKIVRELVQVPALPRRCLQHVGAPPLGMSCGRGRGGPHVDELHL